MSGISRKRMSADEVALAYWLGGVVGYDVGYIKPWDLEVVGSIPGRVAIKWLLFGWVTDCA